MAEKREMSIDDDGGGAKRINALFSSFIQKEPSNQTKDISPLESNEPQATIEDDEGQRKGDVKDGATSTKPETPYRRSFRPLDVDDFFGRVETFTFGWFAKPADLSPLHCARYGWENIDTDCLKCASCREILCGGLPALWETESYSQAYNKLKDSIKTAHSETCPWPNSPSPESFLHIPLGDIKSTVAGFYMRVDSMYSLGVSLPCIDCSPIKEEEGFNVDDVKSVLLKAITERGDSASIVNEEENPVWLAACLLAVFGWQKCHSEETGCPVLVCHYCQRHIGLWNFTSFKEADPKTAVVTEQSNADTEEEPPAKRIKDIEKSAFNPSTEHLTWCPWIRTSPVQPVRMQRDSAELADADEEFRAELSWQQLLVILLKRIDPDKYGALAPVINNETTPASQSWKAVRRVLNIWQSNEAAAPPQQKTDPPKDAS